MTGDLPKAWMQVQLGDVCLPVSKVDPRQHPDQEFEYIDIGGVPPGAGQISETKLLKGDDAPSRARQLVRAGDVVLSTVRTYQRKTAIVPQRLDGAVASTGFSVLRPHHEIVPEFILFQALSHEFVMRLSAQQTGTSYPAVRDRDVRAMSIRLPPFDEQKRIVTTIEEHFSRLDAVDSAVEAAQQKLVAFQRSSFDQLFDKPDWKWTTLGQIAEVKGGVTKDSKNQGNPTHIEVPYLRVANVQRGYLDLDEITTIRVNPEKAARLKLQPGDILFNEGGDRDKLGRGWVWEGQIEDCIHQNHVFRARLTSEAFDPYFVSMHGNSWGQRWFETHGKQTTNLASLNLTTLKSFPVPAPSLDEQRGVVTHLQEVMDLESRLREELDQARRHSESLRRSILSDAFSGRLVPQDPNDEPAAALLDRISEERLACSN